MIDIEECEKNLAENNEHKKETSSNEELYFSIGLLLYKGIRTLLLIMAVLIVIFLVFVKIKYGSIQNFFDMVRETINHRGCWVP